MARSFHRKRSLEPQSELNVTALIDLGFALLIIFMISTPLIEKEHVLDLNLPVASSSEAKPTEAKRVEIVVMANGGYLVDGTQMNEVDIENEMALMADMANPPVISLRTDADSPAQRLVRVLDLAKQYQLSKFNIATRPEE